MKCKQFNRELWGVRTARRQRGFTLVETMVSTGISVFVMGTMMISFVIINRAFNAMGNYADLDKQSRNTLSLMARDIRQAGALTNWTTNGLWFTNQDGGFLTYTYSTNGNILSYTNSSTSMGGTLLSNCTAITFTLFQRTPTNGTMSFVTASNAASAKGILMTFTCMRTNYLNLTDSETIETASIVMRN